MRRRTEPPALSYIWPAFTDVLAGLVVVLVFLITVFVIGEVLTGREISGKNTAIDQLAQIQNYFEALLGESHQENAALLVRIRDLESVLQDNRNALAQVKQDLTASQESTAALGEDLDAARTRGDELLASLTLREQDLSAARASNANLAGALSAKQQELIEIQRQVALFSARIENMTQELARLNRALFSERERLAATEASLTDSEQAKGVALTRVDALQRRIQGSERQVVALQTTVSNSGLELAVARGRIDKLVEKDKSNDDELALRATVIARQKQSLTQQASRLEEMDRLIKRRLVARVEDLESYASEFFGRLREIFAANPDIKIVGDRFIFQSEVLFNSAEAILQLAGKADLDKFVDVYKQLEQDLPADLPVLIEVQGHTDRLPINTPLYRSNRELSIARALGVLRYLVSQGVPPRRLAAVGMGEYYPIDDRETPDAYRKNRRIELKFTSQVSAAEQ